MKKIKTNTLCKILATQDKYSSLQPYFVQLMYTKWPLRHNYYQQKFLLYLFILQLRILQFFRISYTVTIHVIFYLWETAFDTVLPVNKRTKKACEHFSSFADNCVLTCKCFLLLVSSDHTYRLGFLLCVNKIFRWVLPFLAKASDRASLFCDAPNMTTICPLLRIWRKYEEL